jgi:hypothetical protein
MSNNKPNEPNEPKPIEPKPIEIGVKASELANISINRVTKAANFNQADYAKVFNAIVSVERNADNSIKSVNVNVAKKYPIACKALGLADTHPNHLKVWPIISKIDSDYPQFGLVNHKAKAE